MVKIETKYMIPTVGKYSKEVYVCPYCNNNMLIIYFNNTIGFASAPIGLVMVTECDKCFEKFYSHTCQSNYEVFLSMVEKGENKHFKK